MPAGLLYSRPWGGANKNRNLKTFLRNWMESELRWGGGGNHIKTNLDSYLEASFFCLGKKNPKPQTSQSWKLLHVEVDILVCPHSWPPCSQGTLQNSGHRIVSENSALCARLLMSMLALLHWALLFFKLSPMFSWAFVVPLWTLPNLKPRKAPGTPLSESWQIGSVCCVLRKVTSFRLMKQWQFQSA